MKIALSHVVAAVLAVAPAHAAVMPKGEANVTRPKQVETGKKPYCMELRAMQKIMVLPDGSKVPLTPVLRLSMLIPCR